MRNACSLPAIIIGSLLAPVAFVFSSGSAGPAARLEESHQLLPAPAAVGAVEPLATSGVDAPATTRPLTAEERELVAWAYARFALVGLDVPDVSVTFHDDTGPCDGNEGRYRGSGERREIAVCVPDLGTFASDLHRRRTLVHELAHAWDHANLDAEDRIDLLEIVDASDWYAPESDWDERGVERFAETIAWGLYDQLRRPVLIDVPCGELHADFQAITGVSAPGPVEPVCDPPSHDPEPETGTGT